ncbi:MAG: hypothetical protein ACKN9T_07370, partial [Candidatus Methylumidiphilus sp.]
MSRFYLLAPALLLSACAVGPDYQPPDAAAPAHWSQAAPDAEAKTADLAHWWRGFHDRQLDTLIEQALRDNQDLRLARA